MVVAVVAVLLVAGLTVAGYVSWTAQRLDRLHRAVDTAALGLDAALSSRARAAQALAQRLAQETGDRLATTAAAALATPGLGHDRETAENALSRGLAAAAAQFPDVFRPGTDGADTLLDAAARVAVARRFHNDAVRSALVVRRRRVPRWLHLAGTASWPAFFEIDDTLPTLAAALPTADAP